MMNDRMLRNRYELQTIIGHGGFGYTWKGMDLMLSIPVAVKEFTDDDAAKREKFLKEARILARFAGNPGIVNVRDFLEEDGKAYMIMEYLEGVDLKHYIEQQGILSFRAAVRLLMPVMKDLVKIHGAGVLHRDISPDNIRLLDDGMVKLLDFGSASNDMNLTELTSTVTVKPGFAPAEQYLGKKELQGPWTDIYALCATIYLCITGKLPMDSLQRSFKDELIPPSKLGALITKEQEEALLQGMMLQPDDRYQTVNAMLAAFESVLPEESFRPVQVQPVQDGGKKQDDFVAVLKDQKVPDNEKKISGKQVKAVKKQKDKKTRRSSGIPKPVYAILALIVIIAGVFVIRQGGSDNDPYGIKDTSVTVKEQKLTTGDIDKYDRNSKLKFLNLYHCEISDDVMARIGEMDTVENLTLYECYGFTSINGLAKSQSITSVDFSSYKENGEYAHDLALSEFLTEDYPALKKLTLTNVDIAGGMGFMKHLGQMETLIAGGVTGVDDLEWMSDLNMLKAFYYSSDLRNIDLSPLADCKNLVRVDLSNSGAMDVEWAKDLEYLEKISMANCNVNDISALAGHTTLTTLDFSANRIHDLTPLSDCEKLSSIDFPDNKLISLNGLEQLAALNHVVVYGNEITSLEPLRQSAEKLLTLDISGNKVSDLSPLGDSEKMIMLMASHNQISDLTPISKNTGLNRLKVSYNQLTSLAGCESMIELIELQADNNALTGVWEIRNCGSLGILNLNRNQISDLSPLEHQLPYLTAFCIAQNQITSLKMLTDCPEIKAVMADHNKLKDLAGLEDKQKLNAVLVSDNEITTLDALNKSMTELVYLDAGNNQISDIVFLSQLTVKNPVILLENNQIRTIPKMPSDLKFRKISLYGNEISDLTPIVSLELPVLNDSVYIGYHADADFGVLADASFVRNMKLVDVPGEKQAAILNVLIENHPSNKPEFISKETADDEMSAYRVELKKKLFDSEEDTDTSEETDEGE